MKFRWDYELTGGQKAVLLTICAVFLAGGWYRGIYFPVQERIAQADTAALEEEWMLEQMHASKIRSMRKEIAFHRAVSDAQVPSYDHFNEETEELNRVLKEADSFELHFSEPTEDGMTVRRNIVINFTADSYDRAVKLIEEIKQGPYCSLIRDLSISGGTQKSDIKNGEVKVSFGLTYYETRYGSDTEEGLKSEHIRGE